MLSCNEQSDCINETLLPLRQMNALFNLLHGKLPKFGGSKDLISLEILNSVELPEAYRRLISDSHIMSLILTTGLEFQDCLKDLIIKLRYAA